ncbi:MAG TPA: hypothetical protein DCS63_10410 [Elusimicrobia bacterium]|nr:hypothetical protein [Elusimicrobiota bacterium]
MPPFLTAIILKARVFFKDMLEDILLIYAEKGIEPFRKPLLIAGPILLAIYAVIYNPLGSRLGSAARHLENLQVVARYAADYEDVKARLLPYQRKLPLLKDKDEWLNYIITSSARPHGITFDGISGQKEIEVGNFLMLSRQVDVTTTYAKLGRWLADIENSPIFLRVVELNAKKDESNPGTIKASFNLSTLVPRFAAGGR